LAEAVGVARVTPEVVVLEHFFIKKQVAYPAL
jgi:hypothetical protein